MINPFAPIGRGLLGMLAEIGRFSAFTGRAVAATVSPPLFLGQTARQAMQIGYYSLPVVGITAVFIGAALALNIYVGGARFNAEHAVVTIGALNSDGAFDFSIEEAEITRAMIARTRYLTVIADSSKMGKHALFQVFPLQRIDRLIIDRKPLGELAKALAEAQVEVLEAPALTRPEW